MAFVNCSERKIQLDTGSTSIIGPGSYQNNTDKSFNQFSYAPFLSTSTRPAISTGPKVFVPGPGDYEIRTNIADPVIQAMANDRSIIVKINSTGTGAFKSTQNRFAVKDQDLPGPGSYNAASLSVKRKRSNEGYHPQRIRIMSQRKKNPSIPHKGCSLYIEEQQAKINQGAVGPGAYQINQGFGNPQKGAVWGKDAVQRFKRKQQNNNMNIGPGKYYVKSNDPQYKSNPSSSFVSQTVRTYFDKLLYKTNQNIKAKLRKQAKYKSNQPGPGLYEPDKLQKNSSSHLFGLEERFRQNVIESTPGPGLYKSASPFQVPKRQSFHISFDTKTERSLLFISQNNIPGPGSYQNTPNTKFKYSYGTTSFVNGCERFPQKILQQDQIPGPGQYIQQSKTLPLKKENPAFKSTTKRIWHNEPQTAPVGSYNLDFDDISKKAEKAKVFIDNLKKLQVQKAPFDSSHSRFKHYQGQTKKQNSTERQNQFLVKKKKARTTAPSTSPRQQHPGFFSGQDRFGASKKKGPSVGTYNLAKEMHSKSYNLKFQNDKDK